MSRSCHDLGGPIDGGEILGASLGQAFIGITIFGQIKISADLRNLFLNIFAIFKPRAARNWVFSFGCARPRLRIGQTGRRPLKLRVFLHSLDPLHVLRLFLCPINVTAAATLFNWKKSGVFHSYFHSNRAQLLS